METEIEDHCVKNATASLRPTTTDEGTRFITEKNVTPASANHPNQLSQLLLGREQDTPKRNPVRCVDSMHNIHTN